MLTGWNDIYRMFDTMDLLRDRMSRLFSDVVPAWSDETEWAGLGAWPRVNMYDTGEALEIRAEVPGLSREDVNVRVQGNYLEISGKRPADAPEGYTAHRVERGAATFSRSFTLPAEVDTEHAEATLKDGILTLVLPKAESAKPRQIAIH